MKSPQQLSQEIIDIIKATGNYFVGNTSGMSNDGTVNVYHPKGYSISAIAANPISSGEVIVFNVNGVWYAFGEQRTVIKQDILIQRKSRARNEELVYPVITLTQSKLSNPKPEGHKDIEYWLTGGKYSLRRIVTDPTLGFNDSEAFINFDGSDAFLQNAGNGKYLAATRSHELPAINYGGAANREYNRNIFTIQKEDKTSVKITSDFYGNFAYLGNGIYQSLIEDGIGRIFNEVPPWIRIEGATMLQVSDGFGGTKYNGIAKGLTNDMRLDANILPETFNYTIYDGEVIELPGSLTVDLNNIFDYISLEDYYDYNQANGTNHPHGTYLALADPLYPYRVGIYLEIGIDNQFTELIIKDIAFGWRNKTIQHQIWLPIGNSTFNYSSVKTKTRNHVDGIEDSPYYGDLFNYNFNETMSGEVLLMSWKNKYITSNFEIIKESEKGINLVSGEDVLVNTENITSKTEVLTLKTYGDTDGEKNVVLNSDGKFLILPKLPKALNSNQDIEITKDTTHFRINVSSSLGLQYVGYDPGYSITGYIGEPIITSFVIDNKAYLIRGVISNAELVLTSTIVRNTNIHLFEVNHWFTIQITEIKSIPQIKFNANFDYTDFELPFPGTIVIDNGCFWNYYLSYRTAVDTEAFLSGYPCFKGGNTYSRLTNFRNNQSSYLLCDQNIKYIHTNPITVPFCTSIYHPPAHLLTVDNLVGDSIYRVNDDYLIQAYIESYSNKDLSITKMPVSEWKITSDGSIKYNKTFLVDYQLKRPYYNSTVGDYNANTIIPVTHSYYPQ